MFPLNTPEPGEIAELGWCPDCQSPPTSDYAHVHYCSLHFPTTHGESDRLVGNESAYIISGEGGDGTQALCNFIHRRKETHS
jgi:hypothetical protein